MRAPAPGSADGATAGLGAPAGLGGPIELDDAVEQYAAGAVLLDPRGARLLRLSPAGQEAVRRLGTVAAGSAGEGALRRRLLAAGLAHPRPGVPPPELGQKVCVLVPVRDRPEALARCLDAVARAGPKGLEVVVVDDGSLEPARTAAVAAAAGARLVRRSESGGPAVARNTGLAGLERPLVALLDSDCRPAPGWLERLAGHLDDPSVVAVAPRVREVLDGGSVRARYGASRSPLDLGPHPAEVTSGGRVSYVPSAALLLRREALEVGFDPGLRYGEDVDLVWRLLAGGGRVRYAPEAHVEHDGPGSWAGLLGRRFRYGTSAGPLARRHGSALAPLRLAPGTAAGVLGALSGWPGLAAGSLAVATVRLVRRVGPAGVPARRAARLALAGTAGGAEAAGRAGWMLFAPLLVTAARPRSSPEGARRRVAVGTPGARRVAAVALTVGPPLLEWWRRRPPVDPVRYGAACLADDLAYGVGVWWGALTSGTVDPLLPRLSRSSPRQSPAWRR